MGVANELSDVDIESLVPAALRDVSAAEFLDALPAHDGEMKARLDRASAEGNVLRYVGVVSRDGGAKVALLPYARTHAFAGLAATDNVIAFTSQRYASQPLVVRGPGAGPEVTAGGVFADLLRLAGSLG
jgi:aspartokinase/homoserine dehydrogenase 1